MEKLIEYVSSFDPDFSSKIRGASPSEIQIFQELVRRPLPTLYVSYLSRMGHGNGGLFLFEPGEKTDIQTIIDAYQDLVIGEWNIPEDCILICEDIFPSQQLALRENGQAEDTVWRIEGEWYGELYAASLEMLLWRRAFMNYRLKSLAHDGYWMIPKMQMLEAAKNLAGQIGFEQLWFSDDIVYCGEREDATIAIDGYGGGCHIYISAQSPSEFERLGNDFVNQLQAKNVRDRGA